MISRAKPALKWYPYPGTQASLRIALLSLSPRASGPYRAFNGGGARSAVSEEMEKPMYSFEHVKNIVETSIDDLVDDFIRHPYKHRCENSIHCELYAKLFEHRDLQELYPLKQGETRRVGLVHKEWPEAVRRPGGPVRRGSYDLVILDPAEIKKHTDKDFIGGRIRPAIIIEMGLNYTLRHLKENNAKLDFCKAKGRYLIHLLQPHNKISEAELAELQKLLGKSKHAIAAVVFSKSNELIKRLRDQTMDSIIQMR